MDTAQDAISTIDFFGTGSAKAAQSICKETEQEDGEECEEESESGDSVSGKRKKKNGKDVRTKKKKMKSGQVEPEGEKCCCMNVRVHRYARCRQTAQKSNPCKSINFPSVHQQKTHQRHLHCVIIDKLE